MPNKDLISICICTYKRLPMLKNLLIKVNNQQTNDLFDVQIIVIDNDLSGSAKELVKQISEENNIKIYYDIEPERSIPAARNHALMLASGNYIAIIDDDEFPSNDWLLQLYQAINKFDVDGALGPVLPYFEQKPPDWLIKGKFCQRPIYRTGTLLNWYQTRTGNVLLKRRVFDEHGLKFDIKWKTSGSDRAFFKEAIEHGYKFVFVAEAPVYETVPPERWNKTYFIKRAIVHGYNSYLNNIKGAPIRWQLFTLFKSIIAVGFYYVVFPISLIFGPVWYVKCLEKGAHHFSQIMARFGIELIKKRDF
ncbi:MAG: glycosyltransferase family 2 protein [Candidatus Saccharicenans sp.]|nr:glycosyltransferase family 2 protein [Candidatus Saccharicenans sp.]MDI6848898.1 glycosyltransferase family 2 protein [Candidatus Saccharicenans sp.]